MRRGVKVAAWAAVFLACAGVGAYIAAHTDPFPPGVDRPTGSTAPSGSPTSPSPPPGPVAWVGSFRSFTYHDLYVGGRCTTRWRGRLRLRVDDAGGIAGSGGAHLFGKLECDFPIEQTQTRRIGLAVTGGIRDDTIVLTLSQTSVAPINGHDFGGFAAFLPVKVALPLHGDAADGRVTRRRVDEQGRGVYFWSTGFQLAAVSV
jgi:hypothetical protein